MLPPSVAIFAIPKGLQARPLALGVTRIGAPRHCWSIQIRLSAAGVGHFPVALSLLFPLQCRNLSL
jgi:hypothetical protein